MKYAQFYHHDLTGNVSELLGSDGVMKLDGRLGDILLSHSINTHACMLNTHLRKGIVGYRIFVGECYSRARPASNYQNLW